MKNIISLSAIIENAVNNREIPCHVSLEDASRMAENARGTYLVNTDMFYSGRVRSLKEGDQLISFGKKTLNVDELRRQLEQFIGKGPVTIWINNQILKGELVK